MSGHPPPPFPPPTAFSKEKKKRRNGVAFMELTFLKLAGSRSTVKRGARGSEGKEGAREGGRSKKDRSAGASLVDGGNGSLGIALSISRPLGPSATPSPPYGHYARLHSIPFHPFLHSETILETRRTIPLAPSSLPPAPSPVSHAARGNPPVKHGVSGNAAAQALSPLPRRMTLSLFPSMYMHDTHSFVTDVFLPAAPLTEHSYCVLYFIWPFPVSSRTVFPASR